MPEKPTILFAGSGEFGAPTLRALIGAGFQIPIVITQPDKPAGRGKKLTPTPIAQLAANHNLNVIKTANINTEIMPPADLLIVIAFGQKIGPAAVNHARLGSVNLHSSLLPKYRGAAPINWAVLNGDSTTGNSIIRLAEKMDAGAILAQSNLEIGSSQTAGELHDRLAENGAPLMLQLIEKLLAGTAVETPQDHTLATIAPKLSRQTAVIDWTQSAFVVSRRINGLSPWPGCRVKLLDNASEVARLTLLRAQPGNTTHQATPGTILPNGQVACCLNQSIEILQLQPEGKRPMLLKDFINGRPWRAGMKLQSIA